MICEDYHKERERLIRTIIHGFAKMPVTKSLFDEQSIFLQQKTTNQLIEMQPKIYLFRSQDRSRFLTKRATDIAHAEAQIQNVPSDYSYFKEYKFNLFTITKIL